MGSRRTARGGLFRIVLDLVLLSRFLPANPGNRASPPSFWPGTKGAVGPDATLQFEVTARAPLPGRPSPPYASAGAGEGGFDARRLADQLGALRRCHAFARCHPNASG